MLLIILSCVCVGGITTTRSHSFQIRFDAPPCQCSPESISSSPHQQAQGHHLVDRYTNWEAGVHRTHRTGNRGSMVSGNWWNHQIIVYILNDQSRISPIPQQQPVQTVQESYSLLIKGHGSIKFFSKVFTLFPNSWGWGNIVAICHTPGLDAILLISIFLPWKSNKKKWHNIIRSIYYLLTSFSSQQYLENLNIFTTCRPMTSLYSLSILNNSIPPFECSHL